MQSERTLSSGPFLAVALYDQYALTVATGCPHAPCFFNIPDLAKIFLSPKQRNAEKTVLDEQMLEYKRHL